ncbi:MAG: hypothetical protein ACR2H1_01730 [Limisphaerales bacterium]
MSFHFRFLVYDFSPELQRNSMMMLAADFLNDAQENDTNQDNPAMTKTCHGENPEEAAPTSGYVKVGAGANEIILQHLREELFPNGVR